MPQFNGHLPDKLPGIGPSVFATMSQLARQYQAVNLSQGFPDFPVSRELIHLVEKHMMKGANQYAPMPGLPALRQAISKKIARTYGVEYDPEEEITITAGATQAIFTAIIATIRDGDEVIVIEPAYDSYVPAVKLCKGTVRPVHMDFPSYTIPWDEVQRTITRDTRMIIINSPHNPTGATIKETDMERLSQIVKGTDLLVLSDEVYEHLIFDGQIHQSACKYPELAQRSFIMGSFGKTFHATGWKTGYCLAPAEMMRRFRMVHQFVVFAVNTPVQHAIAEYLDNEEHYLGLPAFYQQKRDYFLEAILKSAFKPIPCQGTYFQLLDYSALSDKNDEDYAVHLIRNHGIASIPVSVFYQRPVDNHVLRFCFAKEEKTLDKAAAILCRISA